MQVFIQPTVKLLNSSIWACLLSTTFFCTKLIFILKKGKISHTMMVFDKNILVLVHYYSLMLQPVAWYSVWWTCPVQMSKLVKFSLLAAFSFLLKIGITLHLFHYVNILRFLSCYAVIFQTMEDTWAVDAGIFSMIAVMTIPSSVRTFLQSILIPATIYIIQSYVSWALTKESASMCCDGATTIKLFAHDLCVL